MAILILKVFRGLKVTLENRVKSIIAKQQSNI